MKETERYSKKEQQTRDMMNLCIDTLHKMHGQNLPASFWVTLDMLADAFDIYYSAHSNIISKDVTDKYNTRNPATAVFSQQQLYINRLLNNLGLTPMAAHKMTKNSDAMPSELDEFMS